MFVIIMIAVIFIIVLWSPISVTKQINKRTECRICKECTSLNFIIFIRAKYFKAAYYIILFKTFLIVRFI